MRIGPIFAVMVAMALTAAAVGVHAAGSGLAEGAARSVQSKQLAQTPERSPPPTGQVGPENPTSTAPAPPAAAPPPNPPAGTPATVLDDQEVSTILGNSVRSSADEDMGRIVDIIVSRDGRVHAVIIDFGGSRHWHAQDRRRLARAELRPGRKTRVDHPEPHPQRSSAVLSFRSEARE